MDGMTYQMDFLINRIAEVWMLWSLKAETQVGFYPILKSQNLLDFSVVFKVLNIKR
jgi:hypothetical protein